MALREYITSEKFIWDDLITKSEATVKKTRELWRKRREVPRVLMAWPSSTLKAEDGKEIRDLVVFPVPEGMESFQAAVELAKLAKAYALLLVERKGDDLKVLLESHHGTVCWTMPIRKHGDVYVLEKERRSEDQECLGILWRRSSTTRS